MQKDDPYTALSKEAFLPSEKDLVTCTKCGFKGLKYSMTFIANEHLTTEQFYDAENNPEKLFNVILCGECERNR